MSIGRRAATLSLLVLLGCGAGEAAWRPLPGFPAPDFAAADLAGTSVALDDLEDRVVLLNVWATWCVPCLREMPGLQELSEAYASEGLEVIGVSVDRGSAVDRIHSFVDEHAITYRILHDPDSEVAAAFRTIGVPETFLIGRDGTIVHRWIGEFDPMSDEARALVEEALGAVV